MKKEKRPYIRVDKEKCKGCMLCIRVCPHGVLQDPGSFNKKGLRYVAVKHPEKCTGCGLCYIICPDSGIEIRFQDETGEKTKS